MRTASLVSLGAIVLSLSACGGGGGGGSVASAPVPLTTPPPAPAEPAREPLPPTPATTTGTYQAISMFRAADATNATLTEYRTLEGVEIVAPDQLAPQGSVSIEVDAATRTYTVTAAVGPFEFPDDPMPMTMPADSDLGYTRNGPVQAGEPSEMTAQARAARGDLISRTVSAGTAASGAPRYYTSFATLYNVGQLGGSPRYLSAASWGKAYLENPSGVQDPGAFKALQSVTGIMVFGERTAPGEMPPSGRSRYVLHSLINPPRTDEDGNTFNEFGDAVLEVDFGTRRLSAAYDRTGVYNAADFSDWGDPLLDADGNAIERVDTTVHVAGSAIVASDGGFDLPLSGNGTVRTALADDGPVTEKTLPLTGSLNGAFFGPQAAEVGGISQLPQLSYDGTSHTSFDAFVGTRTAP